MTDTARVRFHDDYEVVVAMPEPKLGWRHVCARAVEQASIEGRVYEIEDVVRIWFRDPPRDPDVP